jgi:cell wall assembly regulator SMI1
MAFTMRGVGVPVSDLDLKRLEKQLNVKLPEGYKSFLKQHNGGRPDPGFYPIEGLANNPVGHLLDFFGIDDPIDSCKLDWNYEVFFGRMPRGFFPIACEDTGNIICLSLAPDTYDHVFYWNHEGETQPPTYANVYKIAGSFQGFLDSLHFYDPLAED